MSAASSRSASRSGTPLGTRPHSTSTTPTTSLSSLPPKSPLSESYSSNGNVSAAAQSNYFSYPVSRVVSGLYRRLTDPPRETNHAQSKNNNNMTSSLYTPKRTDSPFQPPPLTPLTLHATNSATPHILSRALGEEIRLLVPPRLQLVDTWRLAYSLERDGSSLATIYETCRQVSEHNPRAGYVLVVRDASDGGAVFGAYLTDAPHPSSHFYGTGECFLWRASVLASTPMILNNHHSHYNSSPNDDDNNNEDQEHEGESTHSAGFHTMTDEELRKAGFPPPPSADTTHAVRSTTLRASTPTLGSASGSRGGTPQNLLSLPRKSNGAADNGGASSGTNTPERIRFKAFPYSGMNDYMIFCETGFLSVGGGDGHYGLWIDDSVEKGVSASCPTFGNEPLSDEGTKFDILGVEIWYIGS